MQCSEGEEEENRKYRLLLITIDIDIELSRSIDLDVELSRSIDLDFERTLYQVVIPSISISISSYSISRSIELIRGNTISDTSGFGPCPQEPLDPLLTTNQILSWPQPK